MQLQIIILRLLVKIYKNINEVSNLLTPLIYTERERKDVDICTCIHRYVCKNFYPDKAENILQNFSNFFISKYAFYTGLRT